MKIVKPSSSEVKKYLKKWEELDNYKAQESSLEKLFQHTYRFNTDLDDILIKVCSLNDFYSTNIMKPFDVARHILKLNIDPRLAARDPAVVNEIALIKMKNRTINFYSFATKYCSHHMPNEYPIYDSFVAKMLLAAKRQYSFCEFDEQTLKVFSDYKKILLAYKRFFGLEQFDLKQIDKYLWIAGKEYFPKKY